MWVFFFFFNDHVFPWRQAVSVPQVVTSSLPSASSPPATRTHKARWGEALVSAVAASAFSLSHSLRAVFVIVKTPRPCAKGRTSRASALKAPGGLNATSARS